MPAIFLIQRVDNYFQFTFTGEDKTLVMISRLYRTNVQCKDGIDDFRKILKDERNIELAQDRIGQFSFVVRNKKHIAIAHSRIYYAKVTRDYAIRQLTQQVHLNAIIKDEDDHPLADCANARTRLHN